MHCRAHHGLPCFYRRRPPAIRAPRKMTAPPMSVIIAGLGRKICLMRVADSPFGICFCRVAGSHRRKGSAFTTGSPGPVTLRPWECPREGSAVPCVQAGRIHVFTTWAAGVLAPRHPKRLVHRVFQAPGIYWYASENQPWHPHVWVPR